MTEPTTNRALRYAGRRQLRGSGLGHLFIDGDGKELLFKKALGARAIGGEYIAKVQTNPDGTQSVIGNVIRGEGDIDDRAAEWEVADRAAYTAHEAAKREKADRAAGRDRLAELTLAELRDLHRRLPAAQRTALTAQILEFLR